MSRNSFRRLAPMTLAGLLLTASTPASTTGPTRTFDDYMAENMRKCGYVQDAHGN